MAKLIDAVQAVLQSVIQLAADQKRLLKLTFQGSVQALHRIHQGVFLGLHPRGQLGEAAVEALSEILKMILGIYGICLELVQVLTVAIEVRRETLAVSDQMGVKGLSGLMGLQGALVGEARLMEGLVGQSFQACGKG